MLNKSEIVVLRVIRDLGAYAYGMPIHDAVEARVGHNVSLGWIYATFETLEDQGLVLSYQTPGGPERGNRNKMYLKITEKGAAYLNEHTSRTTTD